jgi:GNAT superfamily N-acetyltransferase
LASKEHDAVFEPNRNGGSMMIEIRPIDEQTRKTVVDFITESWGAPIVVTKGKVHSADQLPGFIAYINGQLTGLLTCHIENGECEVVSLDSIIENHGIGTRLLEEVIKKAKDQQCKRVWLITTNDNTGAIRFYQKRGFRLAGIRLNAIEEARKIKPQIPLYGCDNIPILHEIEFEKVL